MKRLSETMHKVILSQTQTNIWGAHEIEGFQRTLKALKARGLVGSIWWTDKDQALRWGELTEDGLKYRSDHGLHG